MTAARNINEKALWRKGLYKNYLSDRSYENKRNVTKYENKKNILWRRISDNTKRIKNNKATGTNSVVNEFLKYGGSEVRNKLLKIMNMVFEKGKVPSNFRRP